MAKPLDEFQHHSDQKAAPELPIVVEVCVRDPHGEMREEQDMSYNVLIGVWNRCCLGKLPSTLLFKRSNVTFVR